MPATTIDNVKFGEIYKSSMAASHNWSQFVKAAQKAVPGIEEKALKTKFAYLKGLGLELKEFDGQKGERGRAATTDYKELAKLFGVKFDEKRHEAAKAGQKKAAEAAKAKKATAGT
jgi:hypothetical protein